MSGVGSHLRHSPGAGSLNLHTFPQAGSTGREALVPGAGGRGGGSVSLAFLPTLVHTLQVQGPRKTKVPPDGFLNSREERSQLSSQGIVTRLLSAAPRTPASPRPFVCMYVCILCLCIYLFIYYLLFLGLPPHLEVPRLGVESELQLPAQAHSHRQQHQIPATSTTYTTAQGNARSPTH